MERETAVLEVESMLYSFFSALGVILADSSIKFRSVTSYSGATFFPRIDSGFTFFFDF